MDPSVLQPRHEFGDGFRLVERLAAEDGYTVVVCAIGDDLLQY